MMKNLYLSQQKKYPYVELLTITYDMAINMLKHNIKNNRPISQYRLNLLKSALLNGEWSLTTDCIGFDKDGILLNGQHRLTAVVETRKSILAFVAYNIPTESYKTIDTGKLRNYSDLASMHGIKKYPAVMGGVAYLLYRYENNDFNKQFVSPPSNKQLSEILSRHKNIEDSVIKVKGIEHILSHRIAAFCHYLFSSKDIKLADYFFQSLTTGNDLSSKHPILLLRNRLIQEKKAKKTIFPGYEKIALILKAWNYLRLDKLSIGTLKWGHGEPYPEII